MLEVQELAILGALSSCVAGDVLVCCCSVVGHFSPQTDDATTVKTGDVVKM